MSDLLEFRELPPALGDAPEHLPAIPGGWTERVWSLAHREFRLTLPADPDAFLDDPEIQAQHDRTSYMPYWAYLWPSAWHLARLILQSDWPRESPVLEIGSGIGLAGLAALSKGHRVTFNDYEPQAVELSLHNARRNDLAGHADGLVFDWNSPPGVQYPIIVGCEVIYEDRNHEPILKLLERMLSPGGFAWFGDGGRWRAGRFWRLLPEYGFRGAIFDENMKQLAVPRAGQFQLFVVAKT